MLFVAGLAIVRAHNRWVLGWPVLVTLVGWIVMLGGLLRMFAPLTARLPQEQVAGAYATFVAFFVVGAMLTFKAYRREDG